MQEFRPADVVDADTRLATSLADGELEALDSLVSRYGRAVRALVATADDTTTIERTVGVFARVWAERDEFVAGSDFAPWIGRRAATSADRALSDVDDTWAVAMAIDAVDPEHRDTLRAHHVDGDPLPEAADRQERRLRRRLAHLGDDAAAIAVLNHPLPWSDPEPDLVQRVRARVSPPGPERSVDADGVTTDAGPVDPDDIASRGPGRVARSLRPALLGLAGAAVVLFVAIVGLSAASGSADPIAFTADLVPTGAILDVEGGELTVTERDSGLQLDVDAPSLPRRAGDQYYEGVLVLQDGTEVALGSFNEGIDVTLSAGLALDRIAEFLVVARSLDQDGGDVILKLDVLGA